MRSNRDVRFTPESGHSPTRLECLLWAIFDRCIAARAEGELIVAFSAAQRGSVGKWPHDTKPEVGFTVRRVRSETTRG